MRDGIGWGVIIEHTLTYQWERFGRPFQSVAPARRRLAAPGTARQKSRGNSGWCSPPRPASAPFACSLSSKNKRQYECSFSQKKGARCFSCLFREKKETGKMNVHFDGNKKARMVFFLVKKSKGKRNACFVKNMGKKECNIVPTKAT